jgi:phosphatidylserine decarboxylase
MFLKNFNIFIVYLVFLIYNKYKNKLIIMNPIKSGQLIRSDHGLLQGLQSVANLQLNKGQGHYVCLKTQRDQNGKIVGFTVDQYAVQTGLMSKIINVCKRLFFSHIDDLKELREIYETALEYVSSTSMTPAKQAQWKQTIEGSFKKIHQLYEISREDHSLLAMAYKMDILEAVSVAVKDNGINTKLGTDVMRVKASILESQQKMLPKTAKRHFTPLIRMRHVEEVAKLIEKDFPSSVPTMQELLDHPEIRRYLLVEKVAAGHVVRQLYKHQNKKWGRGIHRVVGAVLTAWMGKWAKKEMQPGVVRTEKILQFFKHSNISVETAVPNDKGEGELYAYSEIFQQDLRSETSIDRAFQRSMTEKSRRLFLKSAYQVGQTHSPIISNSFCRLRMLELKAGQVGERFSIAGKLLGNNDPAKGFSVKNMLGFEDGVKIDFPQREITPSRAHAADELYRACLVKAVDRTDATVVVQRLAPADIHHFVQPVEGEILELAEACKELKKMLKTSGNRQERAQLESLIKYYEEEQEKRSCVRLRGTQQSVSTLATTQSNPLSQNDRKIQMIRHKDGQISIHFYIGALGVNNVQLSDDLGNRELGAGVGAMGFGNDSREDRALWPTMATEENSVLLESAIGKAGQIGDRSGQFHRNGSTVVCIYFNLEASDKMHRARSLKYREDPQGEVQQMEILTNLGDVIGYEKPMMA